MTTLTSTDLIVMNNLSEVHNSDVHLGTKIQELINHIPSSGTPVNAVNAVVTLNVTGVVLDGQTLTVNNPAIAGSDVYEFMADTAQTKTVPGNIAVDITANTTKSTGTLTIANKPTSGDTMTIGTKVYTFVPVGTDTADGEVSIGADVATARLNIVAAINGTDAFNIAHTLVHAAAFSGTDSVLTALIGGVAGDSIATTEEFTAVGNVFGVATLGGGADCSAANAITAFVSAVTASDTQGVGAVDGTGDTVDFTADTAGVSGNAIAVAETLTNGAFAAAATTFAGGVDGTVGSADKILFDASYLYIAVADNTKAGKNWKKVALSSL